MAHLTDDELTLHYYGETPPGVRREAEAHLAACSGCRAALDEIAAVLALVEAQPAEEPGEGFEREVWARLQDQLPPRRARWFGTGGLVPSWTFAAALAATLTIAFLAGWLVRDGAAPAPAPATAERSPVRERVLLVAVGEHLERSQMVLVELMNAGDGSAALAGERERATELVAANRLYRQTAAAVGDEALDDVLGDLERVLLEVANGPESLEGPELAALRERIESRGLLFRVRVLGSEMRDREERGFDRSPAAGGSPISARQGLKRGSES
ncbi:MAG: hypothetical protein AB7H88_15325 [Vicinamibacterales bacterium]